MPSGYYRFPTLHEDTVVFVCEDDLWTVSAAGGIARRLTSNLGEVTHPLLSPDGQTVAFTGREEGQAEVYAMPALGGQARRLTYLGGSRCQTAAWSPNGQIVFANNAGHWFEGFTRLFSIAADADGEAPVRLPYGLARAISFGAGQAAVIGRNTSDSARWKRYRGGTAGRLWIDPLGSGEFTPLIELPGNLNSPLWLQDGSGEGSGRIYFISDHEGVGNLYSCLPDGRDLRRHTDHEDYYVRNAASDGQRIVYHTGADLYLFDPRQNQARQIQVAFHSPQTQRNRKFVSAERYLESWKLHPKGQALAIATRGKVFSFANWEGAALAHAPNSPIAPGSETTTEERMRLPHWLNDGKRLVAVSDAGGEEAFVILHTGNGQDPNTSRIERLADLDIGRPYQLAVNPQKDQIVFSNHRYDLFWLDLATRALRRIDRGKARQVAGFSWSPDGEWVAYSVSLSLQISAIKLWNAASGETTQVTQPVLRDISPSFDPKGRYLYFLSYRQFDPVADSLHFDLGFPHGMRPYLVTLRKDLLSPFILQPRMEEEPEEKPEPEPEPETEPEPQSEPAPDTPPEAGLPEAGDLSIALEKEAKSKTEDLLQIDLEGIERRVLAFPVAQSVYGRILGTKDGKALYTRYPSENTPEELQELPEQSGNGTLFQYNFEDLKEESLIFGVTDFDLNRDGSMLVYRAGNRLRVLRAGEKPDDRTNQNPGRKSGWIDLSRVKVPVLPGAEWRQMFREAWRLQRDQFWTPDMSQVDWIAVHDRYFPLVERVSSRSEFSDLMWEMQGELGTSHAYEAGGDYRHSPYYGLGFLGAGFEYEPEQDGWRITEIIQGDPWEPRANSPLNGPGVNVQTGDVLLAINGRRLSRTLSPAACLVNLAGEEVALTMAAPAPEEPGPDAGPEEAQAAPAITRTVTVRTLRRENNARYRQWVEANRRKVHAATGEQVGYVHIPDMGTSGYAEFHRGYLAEVDREGLIVDVRFNGGGYVSSLLLEKLARRRLGYDHTRWSQVPIPYPQESVAGPLVALINEYAGSDGDIFSHGFKMLKLGPLVGKRTWGGVIGIEPHHFLVDGTVTTQPEFSFWFSDVGWGIENYGTDPDIEVDITPQEYARGQDPQLDRAIQEILRLLEASPPRLPEFSEKPSRAVPRLPKR